MIPSAMNSLGSKFKTSSQHIHRCLFLVAHHEKDDNDKYQYTMLERKDINVN
jgi:hypothetical protein